MVPMAAKSPSPWYVNTILPGFSRLTEKLGSTGIGKGVAIPHAKTDAADRLTIAFGISKEKIDFKSLDNECKNSCVIMLMS